MIDYRIRRYEVSPLTQPNESFARARPIVTSSHSSGERTRIRLAAVAASDAALAIVATCWRHAGSSALPTNPVLARCVRDGAATAAAPAAGHDGVGSRPDRCR